MDLQEMHIKKSRIRREEWISTTILFKKERSFASSIVLLTIHRLISSSVFVQLFEHLMPSSYLLAWTSTDKLSKTISSYVRPAEPNSPINREKIRFSSKLPGMAATLTRTAVWTSGMIQHFHSNGISMVISNEIG